MENNFQESDFIQGSILEWKTERNHGYLMDDFGREYIFTQRNLRFPLEEVKPGLKVKLIKGNPRWPGALKYMARQITKA